MIKEQGQEMQLTKSIIDKQRQAIVNQDTIILYNAKEIKGLKRKIKLLKIERALYPAIAIIGGIIINYKIR